MTAPFAPPPASMRIDRWLDIACLCKTRSQATEACKKGQVLVNGQTVKPNRLVRPGDRIELRLHDWPRIVQVAGLTLKTVSREVARTLYEDQTPARPPLDPLQRILRQPPVERPKGAGRPTKKARRKIGRLRRREED